MPRANTAAFTELHVTLCRQIPNVLEQAGFYAHLVRNNGAAKTEGVTRTRHVGGRDGSAKGPAQYHAGQHCTQYSRASLNTRLLRSSFARHPEQ